MPGGSRRYSPRKYMSAPNTPASDKGKGKNNRTNARKTAAYTPTTPTSVRGQRKISITNAPNTPISEGRNGRKRKTNDATTPVSETRKGKKVKTGVIETTYYSRDFVKDHESKYTLDDITASHIHLYNNCHKETIEVAGVSADVTDAERLQCMQNIVEIRSTMNSEIRDVIIEMAIEYANTELNYQRFDGQKIKKVKDLKYAIYKNRDEDEDKGNWKLFYNGPFRDGWLFPAEEKYMMENKIEYREWTSKKAAPRGFIAKLFTGELNKFRKGFKWITLYGSKGKMKKQNLIPKDGSIPFIPRLHIKHYVPKKKITTKRNCYKTNKVRNCVLLLIFTLMKLN